MAIISILNCIGNYVIVWVVDEDVHGFLLWRKSLCYSCKCIQDKNGTRMVCFLVLTWIVLQKVELECLCMAELFIVYVLYIFLV